MKEKLLICLLFFITSAVFSQPTLKKGMYTVGGSVSYTSETIEIDLSEDLSDTQKLFIFSPRLGLFLKDHLFAGLLLNYSKSSNDEFSIRTYGIGPSMRFYFGKSKVYPFLGTAFLYNATREERTGYSVDFGSPVLEPKKELQVEKYDSWNLTLSGGIEFLFTPYFSMEGSLNYSFVQNDAESDSFYEMTTTEFKIGVNYYIH
ncbi:MAG: hypothetical protein DWQ05_16755 [Calditrichaeota bacterium]|nr:MAG: hypothetical protein DWQ05_16755 [Calditrichota bacterium]